jgi:SanA protein
VKGIDTGWIGRHERARIFRDLASIPARSIAIVPGAAVHPGLRPSDALEDRLETALAVWRAGKVDRILVSGNPFPAARDEVATMAVWLHDRGVPDEAVLRDPEGFRTLATMRRAATVFHVTDAIVCTQEFHLPRALWLARKAGIDAVGLVADRRVYADAAWNGAREVLARTRAVIDVVLLGRLR